MLYKLTTCASALAIVLVVPPFAGGQERPNPSTAEARYAYAAKFVCGASDESFQEGVVTGVHATAINLHNPSVTNPVVFFKSISRALPYQTPGAVTGFERGVLEPNQSIEVECNEIRQRLPAQMTRQFRTGFVVIRASAELDVVAVYTSRPAESGVSTIDVETIPGKPLAQDPPPQRPDLTVLDILMDTLRVDCSSASGGCVSRVDVKIANIAPVQAGPFATETTLDPSQSVVVTRQSPGGLAAGASEMFSVTTPSGGNCFDPDCTVCVTVDSASAVIESDEANNDLCRTRGG